MPIKSTNLNNIVKLYQVKDGKELKNLKKRLARVPVRLEPFDTSWGDKKAPFIDLEIRAEFFDTGIGIELLASRLSLGELLAVYSDLEEPHPFIRINGDMCENGFSRKTRKYGLEKVVIPLGRTRVIRHPKVNAVGVLYKRKNRVHYVEFEVTGDKL